MQVDISPWHNPKYREFLNTTPVRRTEKERRQQKGILNTPKYQWERQPPNLDVDPYMFPQEIYANIFKYLGVFDLIQVSKCCKLFYQISRESTLWKRHYTDLFFGETRHYFRVNSMSCNIKVRGNIHNPTVYCDNEAHFITPDGKPPKAKKQFYLRTLERLYHLHTYSIKNKRNKLSHSGYQNVLIGISKSNYEQQLILQQKKLDRKFLWVFKKLYPEKYPIKK